MVIGGAELPRATRGYEFINLDRSVAEIKAAAATKPNATVYCYPGQHHAFARHNRTHYDAAAAALANERTHLLHGGPGTCRRCMIGHLSTLPGESP